MPFPPDSTRALLPTRYHRPCKAQDALGEYAGICAAVFLLAACRQPRARSRGLLHERRRLAGVLRDDGYSAAFVHQLTCRLHDRCREAARADAAWLAA